jgi:hypothetical protein
MPRKIVGFGRARGLRFPRGMHGTIALLGTAAVVTFEAVSAPEAHACSPGLQGVVSERRVIPYDGATGVPTNANVIVNYSTNATINDHLRLQSSTGTVVAEVIAQSGANLIPAEPLMATWSYCRPLPIDFVLRPSNPPSYRVCGERPEAAGRDVLSARAVHRSRWSG